MALFVFLQQDVTLFFKVFFIAQDNSQKDASTACVKCHVLSKIACVSLSVHYVSFSQLNPNSRDPKRWSH